MTRKKYNFMLIITFMVAILLTAFAIMDKVIQPLLSKTVLICLSILLGALFTSLIWEKRLQLLEKCCDIVEKDKYDASLSISNAPVSLQRTINTLLKLFNTTKESHKNTLKTSVSVAQSMTYLTDTIKEMEIATEQISSSTENLAEGATDQIQSLGKILESLDTIYKDLENISNKSVESVTNAENSFSNANLGKKMLEETKITINRVYQLTDTLLRVMTDLNSQTSKIAGFVTTISEISDSTNLLALNSSIEAARAGEHGRGFAVVAREVGSLAEQSRKASKDIEVILSDTRTKLGELTGILKDSATEVEKSKEIAEKTNISFNVIEESAYITKESIKGISSYVSKIKERGKEIISSSQGIQAVSEANAAGSEELSAMIQEINASFKDIASNTEALTNEANYLQQSSASTAMEGYMYNKAIELLSIIDKTNPESTEMKKLAKTFGLDDIYLVNSSGIIVSSSENQAINLDSFAIDPVSKKAAEGKEAYLATPIRKRVEDNQMYKFLHVPYKGGVITVSLSLESLLSI